MRASRFGKLLCTDSKRRLGVQPRDTASRMDGNTQSLHTPTPSPTTHHHPSLTEGRGGCRCGAWRSAQRFHHLPNLLIGRYNYPISLHARRSVAHLWGRVRKVLFPFTGRARAHTHIHTTLTSPNLTAASNFDLATFSELHFSTQRHLLSAPPPKPCPPTHLPTHPSTQTHPVCHPTPQLSIQTMPPSERRSKKKNPNLQKPPPPAVRLIHHAATIIPPGRGANLTRHSMRLEGKREGGAGGRIK